MTTARVTRWDAHVHAWVEQYLLPRTHWDGDCRLWTKAVNNAGAPVAAFRGCMINVRRWVFSLTRYPVGPGQSMVATCGNGRCLAHLTPMTRSEVNTWMAARGRMSTPAVLAARRRTARASAKYTIEQARQARALRGQGLSYPAISLQTGLPERRVALICQGKAWKEHASNASVFSLASGS